MNPVLKKIIEEKKLEIKKIPNYSPTKKPKFSLFANLSKKKNSIIAECKKGSPSKGIIRTNYNALNIAKIYEECNASGISVLTDERFFHGSLQDLLEVSSNVNLPTIRKDFIIDEKQIAEAVEFGASAILLIVRILTESRLEELHKYARSLGLDILVETHSKEEIETAVKIGSKLIGINTRDLDTFLIHKDLIKELHKYIPNDVIAIGESGVNSKEDLDEMFQYISSALIGTYFMQTDDIKKAFIELGI
ncbi:MAG: indole-3-glycerol phosphate synthase TrpC [Leptospiraceae bacterium]|nr:indole-3-glycerol phosphate synthase TrpC [Leptospiraceae bacterium]